MTNYKVGYRVGDKVVRKADKRGTGFGFDKDPGPFTVKGLYGSIVTLDRGPMLRAWDTDWTSHNFEKYVEPVSAQVSKPTEYIIALKAGGEYLPAGTPRVYGSESQAKAVAHAMATKHTGQKFVILKAVGEAYTPPVPQSVVEMY